MRIDLILDNVREYYDEKITAHGATPAGVDWNSCTSQELRFQQLLKICDGLRRFSINDYGCGYGALVDYMISKGYSFEYRGFDISELMISKARELHSGLDNCEFFTQESCLGQADYTVASGIFNVKLKTSENEWKDYMLDILQKIAGLSKNGLAINALTKYCDQDHMRSDLYYADPLFLFDYCMRNISRHVSLLHDYPLYEFTVLVRM